MSAFLSSARLRRMDGEQIVRVWAEPQPPAILVHFRSKSPEAFGAMLIHHSAA